MKLLRWTGVAALVLAVATTAHGDDKAAKMDKLAGKWQAVKGSIDPKYTFEFKASPTAKGSGEFTVSTFQPARTVRGIKLPAGDFPVGAGSYAIDGDKVTLTPQPKTPPFGPTEKTVEWTLSKATADALVFTTADGKTAEFKKKVDQ